MTAKARELKISLDDSKPIADNAGNLSGGI